MKIISWNVNGIRACLKKDLMSFVRKQKPDILCLQETKAHKDQVEPEGQLLGMKHSFWSSAKKKGYSGVATFCETEPEEIRLGIGHSQYDEEGRIVVTNHGHFLLYNIYFPNGGSGEERHQFKQKFLEDLYNHLKISLNQGNSLVVVGDYNVAHTEQDIYDPIGLAKESGFLPEERHWMNRFLDLGFTDTFRYLHPEVKNKYTWWSYRELARISNRGWRIDYICISKDLEKNLKGAEILDGVRGSDHCPVLVNLEF